MAMAAAVSVIGNSSTSLLPVSSSTCFVARISNSSSCDIVLPCYIGLGFCCGKLSLEKPCRNKNSRKWRRRSLQTVIVSSLKTSDEERKKTEEREEEDAEELAAARRGELETRKVVALIDRALQRGHDAHAITLASSSLRAFGAAAMIPVRLYSLEELKLHKIEASRFLSPTDATLGAVKRNLQIAAIAGAIVAWQALELDQFQLLSAVVAFIFVGTLDQIATGGSIEALLLDSLGRLLSSKYRERVARHESGHFLVSYLIGILPKSYTLSSFDAVFRRTHVSLQPQQAGTTFVDYDFQEEIKSGKLSAQSLNRFSCVALAGVASEYLTYGIAEGGLADIQQLDSLLKGLNFTQKKADSQVRWAVLNTVSILRRHQGLQAKLALAIAQGKSVGDCIFLIEEDLASVSNI